MYGHIDLAGSKKHSQSSTKQPLAYIYQASPSGTAELGSVVRSHHHLNFNKATQVKWVTDHRCSIAGFQRDWTIRSSLKRELFNKMGKEALNQSFTIL